MARSLNAASSATGNVGAPETGEDSQWVDYFFC
jgi:hypothetical protein